MSARGYGTAYTCGEYTIAAVDLTSRAMWRLSRGGVELCRRSTYEAAKRYALAECGVEGPWKRAERAFEVEAVDGY